MRSLRNSGQVIAGGIACCAAAIIMIGLATLGHDNAGGSSRAARTSNSVHSQLQAHAASAAGIGASKSASLAERFRQFPLSFEPNRKQTNAEVKLSLIHI